MNVPLFGSPVSKHHVRKNNQKNFGGLRNPTNSGRTKAFSENVRNVPKISGSSWEKSRNYFRINLRREEDPP